MFGQSEIDILYDTFGEAAQYNGADVVVAAFHEVGLETGEADFLRREAKAAVRKSEVPDIELGADFVTYAGQDWTVYDIERGDNLEWHLFLARDSAPQM